MSKGMQVAHANIAKESRAKAEGFCSVMRAPSERTLTQSAERRHTEFFNVIGTSLNINTPEDFRAWAQGDLQNIFPHGMLVCGIGQVEQQGTNIQHMLTSNLPFEYMHTLQQIGGMNASPVFLNWLDTRRPVLFELPAHSSETAWYENFKQHNLQNMASHGLCDLHSYTTSYFAFCQIAGKLTVHHAKLLEMLVPHLHVALVRAFKGVNNKSGSDNIIALSTRELEILQCLSAGKSNLEIAQQLHISEFTVKNHVKNILAKLNVKTRAQAVAKTSRPALLDADHIYALDLSPLSEALPKQQPVQIRSANATA